MKVSAITPAVTPAYKKPRWCVSVNREKIELVNPETGERKDFKNDFVGAWVEKGRLEA